MTISSPHFENYGYNGVAAADNTPRSVAARNCKLIIIAPYFAHFNGPGAGISDFLYEWTNGVANDGVTILGSGLEWGKVEDDATIITNNMIRNSDGPHTIVSNGGGTSTVNIPGVLTKDPTRHDYKGFAGFLSVSASKASDAADNGHALFHTSILFGGATLYEFADLINARYETVAAYAIDITDATWQTDGSLTIEITWGSSWNSSTNFNVWISLFGNSQSGSH